MKAKRMANNVIISGIEELSDDEDCVQSVEAFLTGKMKMVLQENDIASAYSYGTKKGRKP